MEAGERCVFSGFKYTHNKGLNIKVCCTLYAGCTFKGVIRNLMVSINCTYRVLRNLDVVSDDKDARNSHSSKNRVAFQGLQQGPF